MKPAPPVTSTRSLTPPIVASRRGGLRLPRTQTEEEILGRAESERGRPLVAECLQLAVHGERRQPVDDGPGGERELFGVAGAHQPGALTLPNGLHEEPEGLLRRRPERGM